MTHLIDTHETSSLLCDAHAVERTLERSRDMLGLTARLLGYAPGASFSHQVSSMLGAAGAARFAGPYGLEFEDPITGMEFVWVPGGSFKMGDLLGDNRSTTELPVHTVTLASFYLGRYAVTQGEWIRIMGELPCPGHKGDRYPVAQVSWNDAQDFLARLNRASGRRYTLPSEAQWEYAAREGGKPVRFGTGKNNIGPEEAHFDCSPNQTTVPVDAFSPNALGLYQMSGNVYEWCQDQWHDSYEGAPCDGSAWGTGAKDLNRVARGGSWFFSGSQGSSLRAAHRTFGGPGDRDQNLGLRLALPVHLSLR